GGSVHPVGEAVPQPPAIEPPERFVPAPDSAHEMQLAFARETFDGFVVEPLVHEIAVAGLEPANGLDVLMDADLAGEVGNGGFGGGQAVFNTHAGLFLSSSASRSSASS